MPILLQEVRRRPPLRRKRFLGVPPIYLVYAAVCSGIVAGWLVRPGGGLSTVRTATITVMPSAPLQRSETAKQAQAKMQAPARGTATASPRVSVPPQPELDRNPVGTIEAPRASAGFRDVQRAAPEDYTGFREVTSPR